MSDEVFPTVTSVVRGYPNTQATAHRKSRSSELFEISATEEI